MNKKAIINLKLGSLLLFIFVMTFGLSACSSPEEKAQEYYEEGKKLLDKGEYVKANIQFKNALQLNNTMADAIWGQALIAEKQSNWQGMLNSLRRVVLVDPKHIDALVKIGRIYLVSGQLDKALEYSDQSIAVDSENSSALALRAAILLKLDDPDAAIEFANSALKHEPGHIDALIVLATERLIRGDSVQALEYLDQGLENDNKNIALQLIKVQALGKLAQLDKAEEVYRKLISYYPDNSVFSYALAEFLIKRNRIDEAESIYKSLAQAAKEDNSTRFKYISFLGKYKGAETARTQLQTYADQRPDDNEIKFALIDFNIVERNYERVEELLEQLISKSPEKEIVLRAKGIRAATLLATNKKADAEKIISEILAADNRNEQALILKAKLDIDKQRYDDSIAGLRTVLRDNPDSSRALLLLASTHALSGSIELADEQYLRAFRASELSPAYGLQYADFLLKIRQPERAEYIMLDVLSINPRHLPTLKLLAQTRLQLGDWVGAQQIADALKRLGDKENLSTQIESAVLVGKKDYDESIALLKQTFESASSDVKPVVALARTYLLAGEANKALEFLDSVIQASPEKVDAYLIRGQVYLAQGQMQKAVENYNKVIQLEKNNPLGYYYLSVTQARQGDQQGAYETLTSGLQVAPNDFGLRISLAALVQQKGDVDKAIEMYEAMLDDGLESDIVVNNLASLLTEYRTDKASHERAYVLSQRFKRSHIPQFKDTFGWSSYKVGKYAEADILLKSALEQLPDVPDIHYHIGMNYIARNDVENARKSLERALELAGDSQFDKADKIRATLKNL